MKLKFTPFRIVDCIMRIITTLTIVSFVGLYNVFSQYNFIILYVAGFVWGISALINEDAKCVEDEK